MLNSIIKLILVVVSVGLASCTQMSPNQPMKATVISDSNIVDQNTEQTEIPELANTSPAGGPPTGGYIARSMSKMDKEKFSRGLDNGIGKSTTWTSDTNATKYTVTPTKKITVGGNPNCRTYHLTATKNNNTQNFNGTACIADDGTWQEG